MKETIAPVPNAVATSRASFYSPSYQHDAGDFAPHSFTRLASSRCDEPLFLRQGDYWIIRYQGRITFLKSTRGLQCLCFLLRHPGREFHVREFVGPVIGKDFGTDESGFAAGDDRGPRFSDAGPILDSQAKAEYRRRLGDLRMELEEARQFNQPDRAARARAELDLLAEQLALAVGLGGRDRKLGSEAERARSAVTKRIKGAIEKIGRSLPLLGGHLTARVKTGYFCSYNPRPDRPVAWNFDPAYMRCEEKTHTVTEKATPIWL